MNFHNVEFLLSAYKKEQFPKILPEICFAGRSNVGKSSMINKLLNRKNFARVSQTPGKTEAVNYYLLDKKLYLADLPGYGYAKVEQAKKHRWAELMEDYFAADRDIKAVLLCIDIRHEPSEHDLMMAEFLTEYGYVFHIVATKADKLSKTEVLKRTESLSELFQNRVIAFSSVTGEGVDEVKRIIQA